ncbi:unnamed protein product [Phyllotreta striolata]|uniref:CHK kinase-like domain-containing protein n=1 Tax=Phyllotreta striolata TaxID=444603 RepID=A0A9N9XPY8_PHYSR|nr:unnamed protein product [Phyllotreta striolata]
MMDDKSVELINWFKEAVGTEECSVKLEGMKEKGDGYMSDINFAKITLNEPNQNGKELYMIAKVSKSGPEMRKFGEVLCKREVAFYKEVVPLFNEFQMEKLVDEPFEALPKCYKTIVTDQTEVIVQENLMKKGYKLHNKKIPMNMNHIKLVMKNYAKFHAISLALREQKPEVMAPFDESFTNWFVEQIAMFEPMYKSTVDKIIANLKEMDRSDLAKRYEKLVERGVPNMLTDLIKDMPEERVVTHADCHNGNFLFEYKDNDDENPTNVVIIDFQISFMFSPIIDISSYLYCGASKVELDQLDYILNYYHKELSSFLSKLGSNADEIFPVATMWEHWEKYSFYGFNVASSLLELLFVEADDAPDFEVESSKGMEKFDINVKDRKPYLKRLVEIVEHYLDVHNVH